MLVYIWNVLKQQGLPVQGSHGNYLKYVSL